MKVQRLTVFESKKKKRCLKTKNIKVKEKADMLSINCALFSDLDYCHFHILAELL